MVEILEEIDPYKPRRDARGPCQKEPCMLPQPVTDYLRKHREDHLVKLFELLRLPSIACLADSPGQPDACRLAADWLSGHLKELGLQADVRPTGGRPCVIAKARVSDDVPTLLIYGHYDVQPPEPLDAWESPPFEPAVRDGYIYARGACDDKGRLFAHLMAVEAWQRAGGGLPVNVTILLEGEEEIGSPNLESFLAEHKGDLSAHAALISDSGFFAEGVPSITYALRGLLYLEVTLTGARQDVHSGEHGGALANPINSLAKMIAQMHTPDGRVTIPGFYDDVLALTDSERQEWAKLPFDETEYAASLGVDVLAGGEKGFGILERRWARPTLDCNGIVGGHTGAGAKTIIPASASTKITTRLVPNQDPEKIAAGFRQFLAERTPAGTRATMSISAGARPVLLAKDSPAMEAAKASYLESFGRESAFIRCGATVPVTELIQRLLGLDAVLLGLGLPDDNLHGPNERFRLDHLWRGSVASAAFMQQIGHRLQKGK